MSRRTDGQVLRLGAVTLVVLALVMAAAFNLQKFPGFRGTSYHAEFSDASGLRKGQMVQVAGQRVGRVDDLRIAGDKVVVDFSVDPGVEFGTQSHASVEVLNLLGEKFLQIEPAGAGQLSSGGTIPVANTRSAYDIVGVLGDLTDTTEKIDTPQLAKALNTMAGTLNSSSGEIHGAFTGLARLSSSIASRDAQLGRLLTGSNAVSKVLADRRVDLVKLMRNSDLVFQELQLRRRAIHRLLVNARALAIQLEGVAKDNQAQLKPALDQLRTVTTMLKSERANLQATAHVMGPYANILGNIIGTGPWFDAYLVNLAGLGTEFTPGVRQ